VHEAKGFRHTAPAPLAGPALPTPHSSHDRWVINKTRALCSWYTKGIDNGSHLRIAVNAAASLAQLNDLIEEFFNMGERIREPVKCA
jgi:hypothetical protein